jgi:hypothetical protein
MSTVFLGNISQSQPSYTLNTGYNSVNTVLSVTGTNNWANNWANSAATGSASHHTLKVSGDTEIDGNLTVKGRDLMDMLETIESRLAILHPNAQLESEFDELKALGDAYRAAEKKLLEQKRVFEILKQQDQ